ncbi:hypothetical protein A4X06_0g8415, partial [Tilletia controversa]
KFIAWRDEVVPFKGPIGCLRTDGGGEFNNAAIKAALLGARHERSCAYTSQQNGVAERYVGLIKNVMRPLLHGRNMPLEYWAEAASTAAYIRNRCPSSALDGKTPYELWHGTQPQLGDLRVFGCLAFAMLSDPSPVAIPTTAPSAHAGCQQPKFGSAQPQFGSQYPLSGSQQPAPAPAASIRLSAARPGSP